MDDANDSLSSRLNTVSDVRRSLDLNKPQASVFFALLPDGGGIAEISGTLDQVALLLFEAYLSALDKEEGLTPEDRRARSRQFVLAMGWNPNNFFPDDSAPVAPRGRKQNIQVITEKPASPESDEWDWPKEI